MFSLQQNDYLSAQESEEKINRKSVCAFGIKTGKILKAKPQIINHYFIQQSQFLPQFDGLVISIVFKQKYFLEVKLNGEIHFCIVISILAIQNSNVPCMP